jgi:hypothetical protein
VRRRLLKGLQEAVLGCLGHPLGVRDQGKAVLGGEGSETEELLERLLVSLGAFLRLITDLVDADRFGPIVNPEIGMDFQTTGLARAKQQLLSKCPRYRRLTDAFITGKAVSMREPA